MTMPPGPPGPLPHPERTALLEARGATLYWDVLSDAPPVTDIHDEALAADWLWDLPAAARELAYLGWARAWWPTSAAAGVPPLDPALLAAELAVATAAVDHLLDDEDAVERAVTAAAAAVHPLAALADDPDLGPRAADLSTRLADLADDHGITLPVPVPAPARTGFALAAGGRAESDVVVQRGSAPVDWALVPQGTVDAAVDATWSVVRRGGELVLAVSVPLTNPPLTDVPLAARFGQIEVPLDDGTGAVTVPPTVLLLPATQRNLTVYAPGFATPEATPEATPDTAADPDAPSRRAALVAMARARLTAPDATLTERAAARR